MNIKQYIQFAEIKQVIDTIVESSSDRSSAYTLAVVSEEKGEGKSFFVGVLAIGIQQYFLKKVLVINFAKEKNSPLEELLELDETSASTAGGKFSESINLPEVQKTFYPGVDYICLSPEIHRQYEFQLQMLVNEYKNFYDYILLDTVAFSQMNYQNFDPVSLSKRVDGVVVVIDNKRLSFTRLERIKAHLYTHQVHSLGFIINQGAISNHLVVSKKNMGL